MTRALLLAALLALAGCGTMLIDSCDRGACLVVMPDGSSALIYEGDDL